MATEPKDPDNTPVRRFVRKPVAVTIAGKEEHGFGHLFFDSQDLSLGGAFLKADLLLEVGEELSLELRLLERTLDACARVAWVRRSEGVGGMGIEFVGLTPGARDALALFLDQA